MADNLSELSEFMLWFRPHCARTGEPQNGTTLRAIVFPEESPAIQLLALRHPDLFNDGGKPLQIYLDLAISFPAQAAKDYPFLIAALNLHDRNIQNTNTPLTTFPLKPSNTQIYTENRTQKKTTTGEKSPSLAQTELPKSQPVPPPQHIHPTAEPGRTILPPPIRADIFQNLEQAVGNVFGHTAAQINRRWPMVTQTRPPLQHVLHVLATEPERALSEDSNLLRTVFTALGTSLSTHAYPEKLQQKLVRLGLLNEVMRPPTSRAHPAMSIAKNTTKPFG
jgi:hypothetical protein